MLPKIIGRARGGPLPSGALEGACVVNSQYGQDRIVLDLLGYQEGGFFLDSGASDGMQSSNTYWLEKNLYWKGICVEPNDTFFASLVRNRTCICLNCCLYSSEDAVDFVEASTLGGILEAYDPRLLQYARHSVRTAFDGGGNPIVVRKSAQTVRSILRKFQAPSVIDYWSLDTEGSELAILRSFPFDEYSFRVLTVEHNNFGVKADINALLESKGYVRILELEIDDCYVRADILSHSRSHVWRRRR